MEENKVGISVQMRLEELMGGDKFEQQLAEYAEKVRHIGHGFSENVNKSTSQESYTEDFDRNDTVQLNKVRKSVEAQARIMQENFDKTYEDFSQNVEDSGGELNRRQVLSWKKKFHQSGNKAEDSFDQSARLLDELIPSVSPEAKGSFEALKSDILSMKDTIVPAYKEMGGAVEDYVKKIEGSNNTLLQMLQQGGKLAIGAEILSYAGKVGSTMAQINAKEETAFDFTSPQGMYSEQQQLELFKDTKERSLEYTGAGSVIGGIAGGLLSGGNPMVIAGGVSFGGSLGSSIADMINVEKTADVQKRLKFLSETYGEANHYGDEARQYDIPEKQASIRFNKDLNGSSGIGYTPEQELEFKKQFGDSLGEFKKVLYTEQLKFGRATGIDPDQIFQFNQSTRLFGEGNGYRITQLANDKEFTKTTFGENSDNKRIVDVLSNIRDLSVQQLQLNVDAKRDETNKFLTLPSLLFGVDNAYGRIGDLGGKTLDNFKSLMKPQSEAQETFLFQALGKNGLEDYTERMKGGIFDGDNLKDVMNMAKRYSHGSESFSYFMLNEMMPNAPKGMLPQLSKLIAGGEVEVKTDANSNKKETVNLEQFLDKVYKGMDGGKDAEKVVSDLLSKSDKSATQWETTAEKVNNIQIEIGHSWEKTITDTQEKMATIDRLWLESAESFKAVNDMIKQGIGQIQDYLRDKFGIETDSKEGVKKDYNNKMYNAVYESNGEQESLKNESLDAYIKRTIESKAVISPSTGLTTLTDPEPQRQNAWKKIHALEKERDDYIEKTYPDKQQSQPDMGKSFREQTLQSLNDKISKSGYKATVLSGKRTLEEESKLKNGVDDSKHLTGEAIDFDFYKEGKKLSNTQVNKDPVLKPLLKQYAEEHKEVKWGGDFKKNPQEEVNHIQKNDSTNVKHTAIDNERHNSEVKAPNGKDGIVKKFFAKKEKKDIVIPVPEEKVRNESELKMSTVDVPVKLKPDLRIHDENKIIAKRIEASNDEKTDRSDTKAVDDNKLLEKLTESIAEKIKLIQIPDDKEKKIGITVKFQNTPLHLMEEVQNAQIGVNY
jgi:uncharacterized protein YcbK (DUF882 family)